MGSSRWRAVARAAGLVACGATAALASRLGFWFTTICAAMAACWLALLDAAAGFRRPEPAPVEVSDDAIDRILTRVMLDQAPTPLLSAEDGRLRALNRAARQLFAVDDMVAAAPPEMFDAAAARVRWQGRTFRIDRVDADGASQPRTILALVDIESEERVAEARATRELLETMGHELMNGIAPIASMAESGLALMGQPERRDVLLPEILGTLARRAMALRRFSEAYRELARLPEPVRVGTKPSGMLDDLRLMFEARWGGRVALVVEPATDRPVSFDRDQITQALWALLQNAAEAALAGSAFPKVALNVVAERADLVIRVSDNGPGFAAGEAERAFRPFFSTKSEGTGLGLGLARQIARAHGGDVRIASLARDTVVELIVLSDQRGR